MMRVHVSQRLNVVVQGLPYLPYMYVTTGFAVFGFYVSSQDPTTGQLSFDRKSFTHTPAKSRTDTVCRMQTLKRWLMILTPEVNV